MACSHLVTMALSGINDESKSFLALIHLVEDIINADKSGNRLPLIKALLKSRFPGNEVGEEHPDDDDYNVNRMKAIESLLKVVSRPFFSFSKTTKNSVLCFILIIAECLLTDRDIDEKQPKSVQGSLLPDIKAADKNDNESNKDNVIDRKSLPLKLDVTQIKVINGIVKFIREQKKSLERIEFVQKYVFENLADMRSNYILRKKTLEQINIFIKENSYGDAYDEPLPEDHRDAIAEFFRNYTIWIHQSMNNSSDEAKSLWLDRLLNYGREKRDETTSKAARPEDYFISASVSFNKEHKAVFSEFIHDIHIENSRVYREGIRKIINTLLKNKPEYNDADTQEGITKVVRDAVEEIVVNPSANGTMVSLTESAGNSYYLNNFFQSIGLDYGASPQSVSHPNEAEQNMLSGHQIEVICGAILLDRLLGRPPSMDEHVSKRYEELGHYLKMVTEMNGENLKIISKSIVNLDQESGQSDSYFDVVRSQTVPQELSKRISTAPIMLREKGYLIEDKFILISLDNDYDYLKHLYPDSNIFKKNLVQLMPVFIYISCGDEPIYRKLQIVRRILMYRHALIQWVKNDFNNNVYSSLSSQQWQIEILTREKTLDHASKPDIRVIQRILHTQPPQGPLEIDRYNYINRLMLLKSYVNQRIARLFQTFIKHQNKVWVRSPGDIYQSWFKSSLYSNHVQANERQDFWGRKAYNLGAVFSETRSEGLEKDNQTVFTTQQYFKTIIDCFDIGWEKDATGPEIELRTMDDLQKRLTHLDCLTYTNPQTKDPCCQIAYRAELIFCLILEVFFSAAKYGFQCDTTRFGVNNNLAEVLSRLKEKEPGEKCKIWLSVEESQICFPDESQSVRYLVFKNYNYSLTGKGEDVINAHNQNLELLSIAVDRQSATADENSGGQCRSGCYPNKDIGLSLWTTSLYIKGLSDMLNHDLGPGRASQILNTEYQYERDKDGKPCLFVQKWPILKKSQNSSSGVIE